jgi:hypothetical protein
MLLLQYSQQLQNLIVFCVASSSCKPLYTKFLAMDPAALSEIQAIPGNDDCLECGTMCSLEWASVSFGAVICLHCMSTLRLPALRMLNLA